jgi:hypothetical protein
VVLEGKGGLLGGVRGGGLMGGVIRYNNGGAIQGLLWGKGGV